LRTQAFITAIRRNFALGLLSGCAACLPAGAAEWQFTPTSSLSSGYSENPRFLPDGSDGQQQATAELAAHLAGGTERLTIGLDPRATFSRYRSDQDLDTNNQYLGLSSSWQTERTLWSGNAQFDHDSTQTSELGTTGLVQNNSRRQNVMASVGPRVTLSETLSTGANVQWTDVHYKDGLSSGLSDYSRGTASLFGTLATSERSRFTLSVSGSRLEAARNLRPTDDASATLGLSHEMGQQWSASLSAGPSWADSGEQTRRGTVYSADVTRQGERQQFTAGVHRRLDPIGTGFLSLTDAITLNLSQRLSERMSAAFTGSVTRNRELFSGASNEGRETRYASASGSVSWTVASAWSISISIEDRVQEVVSSGPNSGKADGYRAWLGLNWNGPTRLL